ncbi:MAG: sulfotransferase domain-containing protein [Chloroflexi bacterium]|nr:sulfotransferase domain-containing protein [Chloroflexota bacterium]
MFVLCVGLYRSGSTWQYQVASDLIEQHRHGQRLGFLNSVPPELSNWAVLKWHDPNQEFARLLARGQALALYCYRDLRDVTFSLMHKASCSFEDLVAGKRIFACCWADAFWSSQTNTLVQRYEAIIDDPYKAVREIAAHLGIAVEADEVDALVARYSFAANAQRVQDLAKNISEPERNLARQEHALVHDPTSLLHWNHVRKGEIGGWRHEATPMQRLILAEHVGDWLIRRGYETDMMWAGHWTPDTATTEETRALHEQLLEKEAAIRWLSEQAAGLQAQLLEKEAMIGVLGQAAADRLALLDEKERVIHRLARLVSRQDGRIQPDSI